MPLYNPPTIAVSDEGTPQGQVTTLDFTGSGVTASVSGSTATINVSGGGGGSLTVTETEIDFGSSPVREKRFTVTDAGVSGTSKILVWQSGNVATGRTGNDLEWDQLLLGAIAGTGEFTLTAYAYPGPVIGKRKVYYSVA